MHNAPAVSYPVGRSRFQAQLFSALSLLSLLASATWFAQAQAPGWRQWLMLCGALLSSSVAYWQWHQTVACQLAWEGSARNWTASDASKSVQMVLLIDVPFAMLLLLRGVRGSRGLWIWVESGASPTRWLALRRAVHQHPRADKDLLIAANSWGKGAA